MDLLNRNDFDHAIKRMINRDIINTRTSLLIGLERMKRTKATEKKNITRNEKAKMYRELLESLERNKAKDILQRLFTIHEINHGVYLYLTRLLEKPVKKKRRIKNNK